MTGTHILCLHKELDGWTTVWREFLPTVRCTIAAFRTEKLCVCGKRQIKGTEGKENPSKIEKHVTQQRNSGGFIHRKGEGATKGERELQRISEDMRIRLKGIQKTQLNDTPLNLILE